MKRKTLQLILFLALSLLICLSATAVYADYSDVNGRSVNGITYELSEDRTYYIVKGWEEQFPSLTIESEIDGIPVKEIRETAFMNNRYLVSITIPKSITVIGVDVFKNCENLTTVKLNASIKTLPANCFENCKILKNITLPSSLEVIDDRCFMNCQSLNDLKIPASVTTIGYDVFLHCESILLDVSENAYAAEYAERNNVNTDFKGTTTYFLLILFGGIAVGLIIFFIIYKIAKAHFRKHPKHDPSIYIEKFFGFIGKILGKIYNFIKLIVSFVFSFIVSIIEFLLMKLKELKNKRSEAKKQKENEEKDTEQ